MARSSRRHDSHRTRVVDGRAELVVAAEDLDLNSRATRWFPRVTDRSAALVPTSSAVSLVLDPFVFTLFVTDHDEAVEFTATHDGTDFLAAATDHGTVDVYVTMGINPRRSTPADLDAATATGAMFGARVGAYAVQTL